MPAYIDWQEQLHPRAAKGMTGAGRFVFKHGGAEPEAKISKPKEFEPDVGVNLGPPKTTKRIAHGSESYLQYDAANPAQYWRDVHDNVMGLTVEEANDLEAYRQSSGGVYNPLFLSTMSSRGRLSNSVVLYRGIGSKAISDLINTMQPGEALRRTGDTMAASPRPLGLQDNMRIFANQGSHAFVPASHHLLGYADTGFDDIIFERGSRLVFTGRGEDGVPEFDLDQDVRADVTGLNEEVVDVGGDVWNRETAIRLEREYVQAKPKLDAIVEGLTTESETVEPPEWDDVPYETQAKIKNAWVEYNFQAELKGVVEEWKESGTLHRDAINKMRSDFVMAQNYNWSVEDNINHDARISWAYNAIRDHIEGEQNEDISKGEFGARFGGREEFGLPRIPYTTLQLVKAVRIQPDEEGDFSVWFSDQDLMKPDTSPPEGQLEFSSIPPSIPSDALTPQMRKDLGKAIKDASVGRLEDIEGLMFDAPPPYLVSSATESAEDTFDGLDDDTKLEWAKKNTNLEGLGLVSDEDAPITVPRNLDPLGEGDTTAYKSTQRLARRLSIERAIKIVEERGITGSDGLASEDQIRDMDTAIWSGWKATSHGTEGTMLQAAIAEELGTRLREKEKGGRNGVDIARAKADAENDYGHIGGFNLLKAYVRAKWETTQWLLDRANKNTLNLYRGIDISKPGFSDYEAYETNKLISDASNTKTDEATRSKLRAEIDRRKEIERQWQVETVGEYPQYKKLPNLPVHRNGAASTSTDIGVANDWISDMHEGDVVVRFSVPRTSVVSVPAYGQNVYGEHEVIIAGGAYRGWDAWRFRAPKVSEVEITHAR